MKALAALLVAAALAGCATAPRPQMHVVPKSHITKTVAPVVEQATPNQVVKHRWYDRFKVHPSKWFHRR